MKTVFTYNTVSDSLKGLLSPYCTVQGEQKHGPPLKINRILWLNFRLTLYLNDNLNLESNNQSNNFRS